jgi:hypothetical protein
MLNGKHYFAEFPDENPANAGGPRSPELIASLRALEKELRPYLQRELTTDAEHDQEDCS